VCRLRLDPSGPEETQVKIKMEEVDTPGVVRKLAVLLNIKASAVHAQVPLSEPVVEGALDTDAQSKNNPISFSAVMVKCVFSETLARFTTATPICDYWK
jgi:hypothetical protein